MNAVLRHVLLIDLQPEMLDTLSPLLRQESLDIHTVESSPFVLDLIRGTPFELLIAKFPLQSVEMEELITAIREPGSMCRQTGFILLSEEKDLAEAIPWMGRGANRIVMMEWSRSRIWDTIYELLNVAPRLEIEIPVQIALPAEIARDVILFRTANISESGALLSGFRSIPEGTVLTFNFQLPGEDVPISGAAEVVRKARQGFQGSFGVAVKYLLIEDEKRQLLSRFIHRSLEGSPPN